MATTLLSRRPIAGVLFAEDFDDPVDELPSRPSPVVEPAVSEADRLRYSQVELDDAVAIARAAGIEVGRDEARETSEFCRRDMVAQTGAILASMGDEAKRIVEAECARVADLGLAMLLALVPSIAARHAEAELLLALQAIMSGLVEPERVVIALPPTLLPYVETSVAGGVVGAALTEPGALRLIGDATLGPVDLHARWRGGSAERRLANQLAAMEQGLRDAGLLAGNDQEDPG